MGMHVLLGSALAFALLAVFPERVPASGHDFMPDALRVGERVLLVGSDSGPVVCAASRDHWTAFRRAVREGRSPTEPVTGSLYRVATGTPAVVFEPSDLVPGLSITLPTEPRRPCFTDRLSVRQLTTYGPRAHRFRW